MLPTLPFPPRSTPHGLPTARDPSATSGSHYISGQGHNHCNSQPRQHYHHYMQLPGLGTTTTPWPDQSLLPLNANANVNSHETMWKPPGKIMYTATQTSGLYHKNFPHRIKNLPIFFFTQVIKLTQGKSITFHEEHQIPTNYPSYFLFPTTLNNTHLILIFPITIPLLFMNAWYIALSRYWHPWFLLLYNL